MIVLRVMGGSICVRGRVVDWFCGRLEARGLGFVQDESIHLIQGQVPRSFRPIGTLRMQEVHAGCRIPDGNDTQSTIRLVALPSLD